VLWLLPGARTPFLLGPFHYKTAVRMRFRVAHKNVIKLQVFATLGHLGVHFGHFWTILGSKTLLPAVGSACFLHPCCGSCVAHFLDPQGSFLDHFGVKSCQKRDKTSYIRVLQNSRRNKCFFDKRKYTRKTLQNYQIRSKKDPFCLKFFINVLLPAV
jgi:hypothetical protein